MRIEAFYNADRGFTSSPTDILRPVRVFAETAASHPRKIEKCWWYRAVQIDFDLKTGQPTDSLQKELKQSLTHSITTQGHKLPQLPDKNTDLIIGFHDIPKGKGSLFERVKEITPLIIQAGKKYDVDAFAKNYTLAVTIDEDIRNLPKRESEKITRMLMARLGALKILIIKSGNDGNADYYALGTMEGGLAIENARREGAIDRLRDRLVTHACARDSGRFDKVENAVTRSDWEIYGIAEHIANASRTLAGWGYIDKPFVIRDIATDERANFIERIMGWSRQSESAIAAHAYNITPPPAYRMGVFDGVIVSSKSGRFNIDKTNLQREDTIPVAIVPNADYSPKEDDPLNLDSFRRYSLGIEGDRIVGPSIEFDEMSAAILYSGAVRVSRHDNGSGFKIDPGGNINLPRIRGFVHLHQGLDEIRNYEAVRGIKVAELFRYIVFNLDEYPYPVGCGKDIMFATSTDAARRLIRTTPVGSGIQVAAFDAMDHGTNFLLLTEPLPDTNFIPDDPFSIMLELVNPDVKAVRLTDEIAQV